MIQTAHIVLQAGFSGLLESYLVFVALVTIGVAAIGIGSRSTAIGAHMAYLAFAHLAIESGGTFLQNIVYVSVVVIFVGFAFKFWRLEMGGA